MKHAMIVLASCIIIAGCRLPIQPLPGPGREGMLYCYTADYHDRELPFCLLGKSLTASKGNGSWEIIPPPTAIFPGFPLFIAEQYLICPAVDTVMIPYDLTMRIVNDNICKKEGVWIKVIDRRGTPLSGIEIDISIDARSGRRIVYNGDVQSRGYLATSVKTDFEGRAYLPIKFSSCGNVRFSGWAMTSVGFESFDGSLGSDHGWTRVGSEESRLVRWGEVPMPHDWYSRWQGWSVCRRCNKRVKVNGCTGVWNEDGTCRNCGKALDLRAARNVEGTLASARVTWPKTRDEYRMLNALTGLSIARIEEICGKCPDDDAVRMSIVRLKGEWAEAEDEGGMGIIYAEGTSKYEYLKSVHQTIGSEVLRQMYSGEMPKKVEGFDAYWDGAVRSMRALWQGEPIVEDMPNLCDPSNKAYRVTFDVGMRRVEGILFEPKDSQSSGTPVLAFAGRGPTTDAGKLFRPSDKAILHLSVFEPGYDYRRGEYDIREKYRLSQHAQGEMYAIDGIDKGREGYFFYPVISGALQAAEWLSARENASGVKCVGTDQGAALALMTAALSSNVVEVAAHHPEFVGVAGWPNSWPQFGWHNRSGLMGEVSKWIPYYELASFSAGVSCPVAMLLNPKEMPGWRRADGTITIFKALPKNLDKRLIVDTSVSAENVIGRLVHVQGQESGNVPQSLP